MCGVYITRPLYPVVGVGAVGTGVGLQSQMPKFTVAPFLLVLLPWSLKISVSVSFMCKIIIMITLLGLLYGINAMTSI